MSKLIAFLCVFMCLVSPYRLFGHAMPELVCLLAIFLQLIRYRRMSIGFSNGYGIFTAYMLFFPAAVSFITNLPGNYLTSFFPINIIFYFIVICVLLPNIHYSSVLKYYKILVYVVVFIFYIQELAYYTLDFRPTFYLPLDLCYEDMDVADLSKSRSMIGRSSSVFLEPAHFAQYILPYYCIVVCRNINERILSKELLLLSITLIILQSGSGYLGMLVILFSILSFKNFVPFNIKCVIIIAFVCVICIVAVFYVDNTFILAILSRIDEITSLDVKAFGSQSGFLRIWRGYFIYDNLSVIHKIFGVGIGSFEYVSNLVYIPGVRYEGSFMNGIQTLLVSGGIVGAGLFIMFIYKICKKMNHAGVLIIICMMAMFFIEHMMFTPKMFLSILVAIAISCKKSNMLQCQ